MMIVHVTGVSTSGLYTKYMVCMSWLVHEDYRACMEIIYQMYDLHVTGVSTL